MPKQKSGYIGHQHIQEALADQSGVHNFAGLRPKMTFTATPEQQSAQADFNKKPSGKNMVGSDQPRGANQPVTPEGQAGRVMQKRG